MSDRIDLENGSSISLLQNGADLTLSIGNGYDSGFCVVSLEDIDNLIDFLQNFRDENS